MYSKVNYTIVGIFVILFTAGVLWFGLWLAKYGLQEPYSTYRLEMSESVAGLSKDSSVSLRGVSIGHVSRIAIKVDNIEIVEVFLQIKQAVPIKEDMFAHTQMLGITGLLSIEIDGGSNGAKTLKPTPDYIPLIASKPSLLTTFTQQFEGLSEKLENLLVQSEKLLSSKHIATLGQILDNTEKITHKALEVENKSITSLEELDKTLQAFRLSMKDIHLTLAEAGSNFKQMQVDFSDIKALSIPSLEQITQASKNFKRVTSKFGRSIDRGDYNLKKILEPMLVDIQILSNQLNDISRELGQNPSQLLFKSRKTRKGPGE
ncbi:MAG: MCE family protein [Epsilonproteobacteria bacterium]|nr:MAG: MCE family protein [Campylobacterota bacterium]